MPLGMVFSHGFSAPEAVDGCGFTRKCKCLKGME
jgi:hypothetical protein